MSADSPQSKYEGFTTVTEALPTAGSNDYISPTVIFLVNDKPYSGHYHVVNGWFYCDEMLANQDFAMAKGRKDATLNNPSGKEFPIATHWRYLRPNRREFDGNI